MMTILPALSISTRAICTPAAATALTALVTSCCRNVEGARAMVRKSAYGRSCGAPAKRTAWLEVVEAVAYRAERGLVVPAVNRDRAGRVLDRSCGLGERHHPPALQQPNQAGLVVAGQASVARVRLGRRLVEAEQVLCVPAKHLGLLAPLGKEAATVLDGLLPAIVWNEVRAAGLKVLKSAVKAVRFVS